jgi:hypothetical protein
MPGMFRELTPYDGRIFKNILPADTGFLKLFKWSDGGASGSRWNATCHNTCTGEVGSMAWKLFIFIESEELQSYPYKNRYNILMGPNSNTFTQWIVDQVPECKLTLPYNAWGKGYNK